MEATGRLLEGFWQGVLKGPKPSNFVKRSQASGPEVCLCLRSHVLAAFAALAKEAQAVPSAAPFDFLDGRLLTATASLLARG